VNTGHPATSWYAATANPFPALPALQRDVRTDVCVVGAGYTGLGAALELASRGVRVVVLETAQVGSGASGRNGGQVHTGQRNDQAWLEKTLGRDAALALWRMSLDARAHLLALIEAHGIACDYVPGMIHARHRSGGEAEDAAHVDFMRSRYGYDQLELVGEQALADELGTDVYHGGLVDRGGGHLHPLNLALGLARAALAAGATIHERTRATAWRREGGAIVVETLQGAVTCDQLILTGDGYLDDLAGVAARARVMPINNFILATAPLGQRAQAIIRSDAAVADSRFVVNYFRKTPDGRLVFGGGENYRPGFPSDLKAFVRRAHAEGLSGPRRRRGDPCLGRDPGHHRPPRAVRPRTGAGRADRRRLFGPGRAAGPVVRQAAGRRGAGRRGRGGAAVPPADPAVPGRAPAALAADGGGAELVRAAGSDLTVLPPWGRRPKAGEGILRRRPWAGSNTLSLPPPVTSRPPPPQGEDFAAVAN
jgi:gamma-glutamylputrescine oxidase